MDLTCSKVLPQGRTKERHLFLFSDILICANPINFQQKIYDFKSTIKVRSAPTSRKIYTFNWGISLKRCSVWSIPDTQGTHTLLPLPSSRG